eukprot:13873773-Alexandrium_andersonii.AAC.1
MTTNFHVEDIKSKKWVASRLGSALENLVQQSVHTFKLKANIKLEPMPEGKAPRMLIADNDDG